MQQTSFFRSFATASKGIFFVLMLLPALASAQIPINSLANPFTQNFNTLAATGSSNVWANNSTLLGWYAAKTNPNGAVSAYRANDGTNNGANLCSFGTSNNNDRSLGSVGMSGTAFAWGMRFKNNTASLIKSVKVTFTGEQWRVSTSLKEQPLRFSYLVSGNAITTLSANETGYAKVPFLNFISPIATGAYTALNGNLAANRTLVQMRFAVSIAPGQEIMLKWYDEDDSQQDHALSIDDVSVQFYTGSSGLSGLDEFTGATTLEQFMKGIILDIPDEDSGLPFALPTGGQMINWENALHRLFIQSYGVAYSGFAQVGYRLTQFVTNARTYYILSKDGASANHWGTYVFSPSSTRQCVNFQAPHPLHDEKTGEQATYLFRELDGYSLMVAGAHRCLSASLSGCNGDSPCGGQQRISDMAHTVGSIFEKTTEMTALYGATRRFIQMHGFEKNDEPYHFVISNGTDLTPANDRAAQLADALEAAPGEGWDARVAHLDNPDQLTGYNNIQGRYLNNYADGNICSSNIISNTVTGRFLHVEQYEEARINPAKYPIMRDVFLANAICNCAAPNMGANNDRAVAPNTANALEIRQNSRDLRDLHCYLQSEQQRVGIRIVNAMGQVFGQETVDVYESADFKIETSALAPGVYFLVADFGAERKTAKFAVGE